jgi:hypothetical protein
MSRRLSLGLLAAMKADRRRRNRVHLALVPSPPPAPTTRMTQGILARMAGFLDALAASMATTIAEVVATRLEAAVAAAIERCLAHRAHVPPAPGSLADGTSARATGTGTVTHARANRRLAAPAVASSSQGENTERMRTWTPLVEAGPPPFGDTSSPPSTLRSNGTMQGGR